MLKSFLGEDRQGIKADNLKGLCFMPYSQHSTDTVDLSSDLRRPLWLAEFVPDCV